MPGGWHDVAEAYRRSFAGVCAGTFPVLLEVLDTGDRVLDVGSGTGAFAGQAADRGATVTAVDSDPSMVAIAATALGERAAAVRGSLPQLGFAADAFDVVVANFVINHVRQPGQGVAELVRVTRPGGVVLLTTWTNQPTAQARLINGAFDEVEAIRPAGIRLPPEDDFERSIDGLAELCTGAGLQIREGRELRWDWRIAWDDLWEGISAGVAGVGQTYLAQSPEIQDRFRDALRSRATELTRDGEIVLPSVAAYVVGIKPAAN
ncbi:class I SAM-dependent methyltransferase [Microlunatus soli]|uniref:Methyltransferase domain-containing protein n=1 Tax=Microlunatus soli TaxID=630515 RepID=A0A1H1W9U3_9ACTN|nr:class I SAM-dependent methyltransferase [Microlunatus soli]SDS93441.1 Methyltransferase domain-containing protein [Microlunatus soli]